MISRKATRIEQEWTIESYGDDSKCYIFLARKTWVFEFCLTT